MKTNKLIIILLLIAMTAGCSKLNKNAEDRDLGNLETEPYGKFTASGKLIKINDEGFHVLTEDNVDVYNVNNENSNKFFIGEYVTLSSSDGKIYDASLDDGFDYKSLVSEKTFDEATKLNIKVREISRDNNGQMKIYGVSSDNKEYHIIADIDTLTNFSYSKLKADDDIFIYPGNITNDIPAVVNANAILMNK